MKIGFLQPYDSCGPPDPGGSLGIWTWEVARRLARQHEVMVCSLRSPGFPATELIESVHFSRFTMRADERLKRLLRWHRRPRSLELTYCNLYLLRAAISLRAKNCDIINIFNFSRFVPLLARLNRQAKIALNMHCDFLVGFDYQLVNRHLHHVDQIIGCSDFITDDIRLRFPQYAERCHTVYNGVNLNKFCPGSAQRSETLITVGRISPEKGLHVLLDAFSKVLQQRPDARLKIIGGESILPPEAISKIDAENSRVHDVLRQYGKDYLQRLQNQAAETLGGRVSFVGAVPPQQVPAEMKEAAILVQPSLYETFGMPPLEAMACGLPIVASRVGGLAELVVHGKTGFLVEPENPGELADALIMLLENPALARAMGAAGRRRADMFSWETTVKKLVSCYSKMKAYEDRVHLSAV